MILLVVSVHGAPAMTLEDRRLSSTPKWVNPCGLAAEDFTGDLEVVQLTDSQLLHQVVVQAKTALMHAKLFRDDYVSTRILISFPPISRREIRISSRKARSDDMVKNGETLFATRVCFLSFSRLHIGASSRRSETKMKSLSMVQ